MIIEIRKVGFINKGAELMLLAIIDKLRSRYPNIKIVMQPSYGDYLNRAKLGLYQKIHFRRYGIAWDKIFSIIPKGLLNRFGLVLDNEIDIVIDAAGFAYTDQWGIDKIKKNVFDMKIWKKQKTTIIMMPQALGPFKLDNIRVYVERMCKYADIIYARDKVSYRYVKDVVGDIDNLKISPDFTNLIQGIPPTNFNKEENQVCIIPNIRMLDMTSEEDSHNYQTFMAKCLKIIHKANLKPFFLIHEGKDDLDLARKIMKIANIDINIIVEPDALKIKGIIAQCKGMLGSRFHGLVSALSQGIPVVATGWSHKYQMLLEDYDFKDGLLTVTSSDDTINKVLLNITDEQKRLNNIKKITAASLIQKKLANNMWDNIFNLIDTKNEMRRQ